MNHLTNTIGFLAAAGCLTTSASAAIGVTNGDFESPDINAGEQVQDVPDWFDSAGDYTTWHRGESADPQENGTQIIAFGPGIPNNDAYIYQSLGTLDVDGGTLDWSLDMARFDDGNASVGINLRFYSGDAVGADGVRISTLGLSQIGSDITIEALGSDTAGTGSRTETGSVDLTGLTAGTQLWIELDAFRDTANYVSGSLTGYGPVDNITATIAGGPALAGDTDGDGDVDDADLGVAFSNYTGPLGDGVGDKAASDGDTDGDGDVDDADLGNAFSAYTGPIASAAVPEPTSLALTGLAGLALIRRRRATP
jgi:hypothetical protein